MIDFENNGKFELVLAYLLDVCRRTVAARAAVTPVAVVGHVRDDKLEGLKVFDLSKVQAQSKRRAADFVNKLVDSDEFGFVAYVSAATVVESGIATDEEDSAGAAQPAILTLLYIDGRRAVAHHPLSMEQGVVIPGALTYTDEQGVLLASPFMPTMAQLH